MLRRSDTVLAAAGALAACVLGFGAWLWWRFRGGGPGDIGMFVVLFAVMSMQSVPLAGPVALLWERAPALRKPLGWAAFAIGVSLFFGGFLGLAPLAALLVSAQALLSKKLKAYFAWLAASVVSLVL